MIDRTKLLIYLDEKPIGCTTEVEFVTSKHVFQPCPIESPKEWTFTCEGIHKHEYESEELNKMNTKTMEMLSSKFGLNPTDLYKIPAVKKDDAKTMSLLK